MAKKTVKKKTDPVSTKKGAKTKQRSTAKKKASTAKKSTTPKKRPINKGTTKKKGTIKKSTAKKKSATKKKQASPVKKRTKSSAKATPKTKKKAVEKKTAKAKSSSNKTSTVSKSKTTSKKSTQSTAKKQAKPKTAASKAPKQKTIIKAEPKTPKIEFPTTKWGADGVISFEATNELPPPEITSIAGGFAFYDGKLVLANVPGRGWEIIGGRIDIGENPEDTFRREALNQIGVTFKAVKMIGVIRIEHTGPEPPNCPYPYPVGYGIQYIGIVDELFPFRGGENSLGRSLITQEGFKEHYYNWNDFIDAIFQYAFTEYKKWAKKMEK